MVLSCYLCARSMEGDVLLPSAPPPATATTKPGYNQYSLNQGAWEHSQDQYYEEEGDKAREDPFQGILPTRDIVEQASPMEVGSPAPEQLRDEIELDPSLYEPMDPNDDNLGHKAEEDLGAAALYFQQRGGVGPDQQQHTNLKKRRLGPVSEWLSQEQLPSVGVGLKTVEQIKQQEFESALLELNTKFEEALTLHLRDTEFPEQQQQQQPAPPSGFGVKRGWDTSYMVNYTPHLQQFSRHTDIMRNKYNRMLYVPPVEQSYNDPIYDHVGFAGDETLKRLREVCRRFPDPPTPLQWKLLESSFCAMASLIYGPEYVLIIPDNPHGSLLTSFLGTRRIESTSSTGITGRYTVIESFISSAHIPLGIPRHPRCAHSKVRIECQMRNGLY